MFFVHWPTEHNLAIRVCSKDEAVPPAERALDHALARRTLPRLDAAHTVHLSVYPDGSPEALQVRRQQIDVQCIATTDALLDMLAELLPRGVRYSLDVTYPRPDYALLYTALSSVCATIAFPGLPVHLRAAPAMLSENVLPLLYCPLHSLCHIKELHPQQLAWYKSQSTPGVPHGFRTHWATFVADSRRSDGYLCLERAGDFSLHLDRISRLSDFPLDQAELDGRPLALRVPADRTVGWNSIRAQRAISTVIFDLPSAQVPLLAPLPHEHTAASLVRVHHRVFLQLNIKSRNASPALDPRTGAIHLIALSDRPQFGHVVDLAWTLAKLPLVPRPFGLVDMVLLLHAICPQTKLALPILRCLAWWLVVVATCPPT